MKHSRRQFLNLAAGAIALPTISGFARAQSYPSRPVRIVVADVAGTTPDILARLIAQWLSERLGQQFIVENRSGGAGNLGIEVVVRAPTDDEQGQQEHHEGAKAHTDSDKNGGHTFAAGRLKPADSL